MASAPKKANKPAKKVAVKDLKAKNAGAVKGGIIRRAPTVEGKIAPADTRLIKW
jgi:hypothetical protein